MIELKSSKLNYELDCDERIEAAKIMMKSRQQNTESFALIEEAVAKKASADAKVSLMVEKVQSLDLQFSQD